MKLEASDRYFDEKKRALEALHLVVDPELFVNIVDLGLIYDLDFIENTKIAVTMTLSTPHCPMGESIVNGVDNVLGEMFSNYKIDIELVWEPEWSVEMITEEGKRQLGIER